MTTLDIQPDVKASVAAVLRDRKKRFPLHVNRISALDDPCLRRLYYMRHDWDKASESEDGLQGLFETGKLMEPVIERIVSEVGLAGEIRWRIVGSQMPTNDTLLAKYQISGTIDGLLQVYVGEQWATLGVVDIKTMSPNVYARIETADDLTRYPWTAKYRGQVMLYSLAHNLGKCFLLLVNKSNLYDMKLIAFDVDMDYCESLLQKAEAVNKAIVANEAPEGMNDTQECPKCQFFAFCHPPISSGKGVTIADSDELGAVLDRLEQLAPVAKEIGELEGERDALLPKGVNVVCGSWLVTWKKSEIRKKAQAASVTEQWRKKIVKAT
jgi:hypothetical protein